MIPLKTIEDLIGKHALLEKELSSGSLDKKALSKDPEDSSFSNSACLPIKSSIVLSGIIYFFLIQKLFFQPH